jgi:hypothetical protein
MRGLQAAVILMGVLIVLGVGVIGVTIARRLGAPAAGPVALVLDEPAGTRMMGAAAAGDRLAVLLQGGGPDRVVLVDPRTGAVAGRVGLAR